MKGLGGRSPHAAEEILFRISHPVQKEGGSFPFSLFFRTEHPSAPPISQVTLLQINFVFITPFQGHICTSRLKTWPIRAWAENTANAAKHNCQKCGCACDSNNYCLTHLLSSGDSGNALVRWLMFAHWPLLSAPHGWQRRKFRRKLLRLPGKINKLDAVRKWDQ